MVDIDMQVRRVGREPPIEQLFPFVQLVFAPLSFVLECPERRLQMSCVVFQLVHAHLSVVPLGHGYLVDQDIETVAVAEEGLIELADANYWPMKAI